MKIITKIFPNGGYHISSGWGYREFEYNKKIVKDFHNGIDYATNGVKLPQYAVEDGYIISCGKASDGANYIWVAYPRIGKKFLHYHLDSISVSKGQSVSSGTLLGYTGMTGMATGIHLHLGMKDINGTEYQNVEEYDYQEGTTPAPIGEHKIGDVVTINGVYVSSTSTEKLHPLRTTGKITRILLGRHNPYLLDNGDLGWVNDACIVSNTPSQNRYYTVQKGDTLWAISKKYYGEGNKYPIIAKANNIANPDIIHTGQKLLIP